MTPEEWAVCNDPARMLVFVQDRISPRRLRLFACACTLGADCNAAHSRAWEEVSVMATVRHALTHTSPGRAAALLRDLVGNPFRPTPGSVIVESDHWICPGCGHHLLPDKCDQSKTFGPCECGRWEWRQYTQMDQWRTPTVLALARNAYDETGRPCGQCWEGNLDPLKKEWIECPDCRGTGHTGDGLLDPDRLAVLADALEEAGCVGERYEKRPICPMCSGDGHLCERGDGECWRCGGTGLLPYDYRPHPLLIHLRSPGPHYRGCWALDLVLGKE